MRSCVDPQAKKPSFLFLPACKLHYPDLAGERLMQLYTGILGLAGVDSKLGYLQAHLQEEVASEEDSRDG